MIIPNKYTDLNLTVISIGGMILKILKEIEIIKYDDLLNRVINNKGQQAKDMFLPSLNFLFILGKIKYYTDIDSIEAIK